MPGDWQVEEVGVFGGLIMNGDRVAEATPPGSDRHLIGAEFRGLLARGGARPISWIVMMVGFRLVSVVLVMTLAGGAQACLALCAGMAAKANVVAVRTEKAPCHHCPEKAGERSKPDHGGGPCKQCQVVVQDRVAVERDHSLGAPALELTFLPVWDVAPAAQSAVRGVERAYLPVHGPPGGVLHAFCVLLI